MNKFTEPPPPVGDPDWPAKFQAWWWRKCEAMKVDPIETMKRALGVDDPFEELLKGPTEAEINQFLEEWDRGEHQLTAEDEAALDKAGKKLFEELRRNHGKAKTGQE